MTNATLSAVGIMATASLLVTVNDALVKEALRFAGTAEVLFFRGLFALAPFLVYALLRRRPEALLPHGCVERMDDAPARIVHASATVCE